MAQVTVEKIQAGANKSPSIFDGVKDLLESVRLRAFQLFERRDGGPGSEVDDWLKAEQDLIWAPQSDLVEKDGRFEVQVAVPGFDAKDVDVAATADTLTVHAEAAHKHEKDDRNVHFCEFGGRELFRQFRFPTPIDVNKVTANLDKGLLCISAAKKEPKLLAAAAS